MKCVTQMYNVAVSLMSLLQPKGMVVNSWNDKVLILLELSLTQMLSWKFLSIHLKFKGHEIPKNLLV